MLTFEAEFTGLDAAFDSIKAKAAEAIRPAAQAGAQVFYDAVKATAPISKQGHWFQGSSAKKAKGSEAKRSASYWFESGSLKNAVYQVYSKDSSGKDNAEYQVAWNHRKVPYGFMVAFGTSMGAKANDFIGKAKLSVQQQAIIAMQSEFAQRMAR